MRIGKYHIQFYPRFEWFWRTCDRYVDYPDIVNVTGGGPFFQYEYYVDFCPKKHRMIKITGMN